MAHIGKSELERLREEGQKFQSSLGYIRSPKAPKIKTTYRLRSTS